MRYKIVVLIMVLAGILVLSGCSSNNSSSKKLNPAVAGEKITIFKSLSCGCCGIFSQYMRKEGFDVDVQTTENIDAIKEKYKIPENLRSCHTSVVGDYFVEGHIPSEAFEKLLNEKPDIAGIAMPGMPQGSPGMPGTKQGTWTIYAVHHDGSTSEFMKI